jgi:hypothetical protein
MGQILHGSARTTEAVRRAIQLEEREPEGSVQALRDQPEDCRQVEAPHCGQGLADRPQGCSFDCMSRFRHM